jgi:hypothetical protein
MDFGNKHWEVKKKNKPLKENLEYKVTEQNRLDLIFFAEWIPKKEHNYSFLSVRDFNFENIGKFLFVPILKIHEDFVYIVSGTALRIVGSRDISNISCYINSGLAIYPKSDMNSKLFLNSKNKSIKNNFNFNFQNLILKNIYDYVEIKESTYFITYFEGFDNKASIILKNKLQWVYLNFLLLRLFDVFNNLKSKASIFKLFSCNNYSNFDRGILNLDLDLNFYFLNLKTLFSKSKKGFTKKFKNKNSITCLFLSGFNLAYININYKLNNVLLKLKKLKWKRFIYKRKPKFRLYKIDLPLIPLKQVYLHPYKLSKLFDRRKLKRLTVLGNKKLVSLSNFNSSGLNSIITVKRGSRSKYKKARLISMWNYDTLAFRINKNDWSNSDTVYSNYFNSLLRIKGKKRKLKNFNHIFNKAFSKFIYHNFRYYNSLWKPSVYISKFKYKQWFNMDDADVDKPHILKELYVNIDKKSVLDDHVKGWKSKEIFYRNVFWNPELFDSKVESNFNFDKFKTRDSFISSLRDYGVGDWSWKYKLFKLGAFTEVKLDSLYTINKKILLRFFNFQINNLHFFNKLHTRYLSLSPFVQRLWKRYKNRMFWKRIFWLTGLWKVKKKKLRINNNWFKFSKRFHFSSFFLNKFKKNELNNIYKRNFINNIYKIVNFKNLHFDSNQYLTKFRVKNRLKYVYLIKNKTLSKFNKYYNKSRKWVLRSLLNKDEFFLVSIKIFYFYIFLNSLILSFHFWLKHKTLIDYEKKKEHVRSQHSISNLKIYQIRRWDDSLFFDSQLDFNLRSLYKVKDISKYIVSKGYSFNKNQLIIALFHRCILFFINLSKYRNFWRFRPLLVILLIWIYKSLRRFFIINTLFDSISTCKLILRNIYNVKFTKLFDFTDFLSFSILNFYFVNLTLYNSIFLFTKVWPYNIQLYNFECIFINRLKTSGKQIMSWTFSSIYKLRKVFITFSFEKYKKANKGRLGLKLSNKFILIFNKKRKFLLLKSFKLYFKNSLFYDIEDIFNYKEQLFRSNLFYHNLFLSKSMRRFST